MKTYYLFSNEEGRVILGEEHDMKKGDLMIKFIDAADRGKARGEIDDREFIHMEGRGFYTTDAPYLAVRS